MGSKKLNKLAHIENQRFENDKEGTVKKEINKK